MNILLLGPSERNKNIKDFLISRGNNIVSTTKVINLGFLSENQTEFIISNGYAPIIKEPIITAYKNKIINIHPTYLPYGRGIFPNFWSFFEGTLTGVSIHFINQGIDTGDILFRMKVSLSDHETLRSAYGKLLCMAENLFLARWADIVKGDFQPIKQSDFRLKSRYRNRANSESLIDLLPQKWETPTTTIEIMGAEFYLSEQFWQKYDDETQQIRSVDSK